MKHLFRMAILSAALLGTTACSGASDQPEIGETAKGSTKVDLFGKTLSFNLPAGFTKAVDNNNGTNVLIEYVPAGETVENWTRLITIQAYRGLGQDPRPTEEIARQAFYPAACTDGPIYQDQGERQMVPGLNRTIIVNGCASLPAGAYPAAMAGAGEQDFIMVFRDAETIYTLNYAERGAPFSGKEPPRENAEADPIMEEILGPVSLD